MTSWYTYIVHCYQTLYISRTNFICFTIVLFPDSPAPASIHRKITVTHTPVLLFYSSRATIYSWKCYIVSILCNKLTALQYIKKNTCQLFLHYGGNTLVQLQYFSVHPLSLPTNVIGVLTWVTTSTVCKWAVHISTNIDKSSGCNLN